MLVTEQTSRMLLPSQQYHATRRHASEDDWRHQRWFGILQPNVETYDDMMKELWNWRPHTKMAEQDFLSWFWARNCATVAMHKKYNLQIHQMYFSTPFGTEEGESQNSASRIIQHPDDIRTFHFSAVIIYFCETRSPFFGRQGPDGRKLKLDLSPSDKGSVMVYSKDYADKSEQAVQH